MEKTRINSPLLYKVVGKLPNGEVKGNVDIDIAIQAVHDTLQCNLVKAYIMTNDGDYNSLIDYLYDHHVWGGLFAPDIKTASRMIKNSKSYPIIDLQDIQEKIKKSPTNKLEMSCRDDV